jgi:hypothetical protein
MLTIVIYTLEGGRLTIFRIVKKKKQQQQQA